VARGGTGLTALGTGLQVLRVNAGATALEYATVSGTGDVVGPASSVDNRVVLFDDVSGKAIKDSGFLGSDVGRLSTTQTFTGDKTFSGALTIPASITVGANTFARSGAHGLTLTTTGTTNVTLPTTGTLATLGGVETFTGNKTFSGTVTMPSTISFTSLGSIVKAGNFAHTLTTTATSNSTFPAGTHTLAALGLAQTFSAAQTFSGGISGNVAFDTNTLFVDATNDRVSVGTTTPGTQFEVTRATGTATPTPAEIRIRTTSNAGDWSTSLPWGRLSFYSDDASATGARIHASVETIARTAVGAGANLSFKVDDQSGNLTERLQLNADGPILLRNKAGTTVLETTDAGAVTLNQIHNIGSGNVTSGRYTPTVTEGTNLTSGNKGTPQSAHYLRVGNTVTVSVRIITVTPNAGAPTNTELYLSLPISSNFTSDTDCAGNLTVIRQSAIISNVAGIVIADATNDRAHLIWMANSTGATSVHVTFQYEVK
jgi:hypothetical protein